MPRTSVVSLVAVLVLVFLASCGSSDDPDPVGTHISPFMREWVDSGVDTFSDFEHAVLEDYWVSEEEWQEAQDLFYQCMNDLGLEGSVIIIGSSVGHGLSDPDMARMNVEGGGVEADVKALLTAGSQKALDCSEGTVSTVGIVYAEAQNNPDGLDRNGAVRRCWSQQGYEEYSDLSDDEIHRIDYGEVPAPDPGIMDCLREPAYSSD